LLLLMATLAAAAGAVPAAQSADCSQAAARAASRYDGARVLSVRQEGGACVVVLLVPGQAGKPPRQEIVRENG
jgi:hypothetical protein